MALIKCYECGKEISDKAPSCPHCGAPKLVAANKKVKTKKSLVFSKYLKPIGIGLGVIVLPLAAVASVPLIQADGNIEAVVWRFKNKKFIDSRCVFPLRHFENKSLPKGCKSILYKLGKKSEKVKSHHHDACIKLRQVENTKIYNTCIDNYKKAQARLKRNLRLNSGPLDQTTHKGKTYTASRKCPVGQNMYWSVTSGFMRKTKVSELGCMTKAQNEAFWRDYNLRQAGAPRGGGGGSGAAARMDMETKMRWNNINQNYRNDFKNWQMKEFGY